MARIVVIGAGVVGMSTAVRIQDLIPGSKVTIIADNFFKETTSYGAGGIFRPLYSKNPDVAKEDLRKWLKTSWLYLTKLAWSPEGGVAGVTPISGYHLWNTNDIELPITKDFTTDFRFLSEEELGRFPLKYRCGAFYSTLVCECRRYLPYLARRFQSRGGSLIKRHVNSLKELTRDYDIIVNCAALGNRKLVGDHTVVPIRGHLIRAKAPWLKHFIYTEDDSHLCHLIPGSDDVIIGGTKDYGNFDTTKRNSEQQGIWDRATSIYPPLKGSDSSSIEDWIGLRPYRPSIRLETVHIYNGSKKIPVVYNYGHGAEGVSLSWGTATEAAEMVKDAVQSFARPPSRL